VVSEVTSSFAMNSRNHCSR